MKPSKYPFQFYYELFETDYLNKLLEDFFDQDFFIGIYKKQFQSDHCYVEIIWNKENGSYNVQLNYSNKEPENFVLSFDRHLSQILDGHFTKLKKQIRFNCHTTFNEQNLTTYIQFITKEIKLLKGLILSVPAECIGPLLTHLEKINSYLDSYLKIENGDKPEVRLKLKWNGKLNVLTTLFQDLNSANNNLGIRFIDVNEKDLKTFLATTFYLPEGEIKMTTLNDYFTSSKKGDKRSKNGLLMRESSVDVIPVPERPKVKKLATNKDLTKYKLPKGYRDSQSDLSSL
jgi:hypothetical protein